MLITGRRVFAFTLCELCATSIVRPSHQVDPDYMRSNFCLLLITFLAVHLALGQSIPETITGNRIQCVDNLADQFQCNGIDLLALISKKELDPLADQVNDIWGWTDPESRRDYALVGTSRSVGFVDVSDPINPVYLGKLVGRSGEILWRDMKIYKDHMFVVVDRLNNGMQIFDLRQLRSTADAPKDWQETAYYDEVSSAHNLAINEDTGFAYITGYTLSDTGSSDTCMGQGIHMVNIQDPTNPVYAGCIADPQTGFRQTGYTHDAQCVIYQGPDKKYQGREICIGSNETHISIVDVTNKREPRILSAASYPNVAYAHQGWLTEDQGYFLMNDEADEANPLIPNTRTIIWDLTSLEDPVYHSSFFFSTNSPDHNLYVHGDYMYAANYSTGLRIVEISSIENPVEIAYFDTFPHPNGSGFGGAWSSFRFSGSGTTIVSSDPHGLFILDVLNVTITDTEILHELPDGFTLSPAYPNPFNPTTSFTISVPIQTYVQVEVFDILGRSTTMIHEGGLNVGEHTFLFDGSQLPSGSYEIRVSSSSHVATTRVVLIK